MTTNSGLTVQTKVHFTTSKRGRKVMHTAPGSSPGALPTLPALPGGRTPRVARVMALAIRLEGIVERGDVRDYADLARLGHVTRARVTQIMNLTMLAPDIQEAILFLPPTVAGRDAIKEWQVRAIAAEMDWGVQRGMWRMLSAAVAT